MMDGTLPRARHCVINHYDTLGVIKTHDMDIIIVQNIKYSCE